MRAAPGRKIRGCIFQLFNLFGEVSPGMAVCPGGTGPDTVSSTVHIPLEQFPVITRIGKSAGLGCLGDRTETFLQKRKTLLNTVI